jgi:glutathione S-transferase
MAEAITLITNRICPFAQRAWLTLLEKNVQFTFKEASLTDKEAWFTEAYLKAYGHDSSSNGKVPILIHGDTVITESDLISWYVAESFPSGNELIPENRF